MAIAWLFLVLVLTLGQGSASPDFSERVGRWCLICGERGLADFILNVALFLPFGWAVAAGWGRGWAVLTGFGVSVAVELIQIGLPGRYATLGDVIANGSGAFVGALILGREARTLPWLAAGALFGVAAPFALLAPDPPPGVYYGQWTARFGNMAHYEGRVLNAEVGGVSMASRRSDRSGEVRAALEEDGPVMVAFEVGPEPGTLAPIFSVFDGKQRRIFLLGAEGKDIVVHRWTRSTTWKLDSPKLRWSGVLAGLDPGDTARVRYARGDDTPCLTVNRRMWCETDIGAGSGWAALLSPDGLRAGPRMLVNSLWMVLLGAVLGVQSWAPGRRWTLILLVAGSVLVLPPWVPYLASSPLPALWLLAGAVVGSVLRSRAAVS